MRIYRILAVATAAAAYLLILLGGVVRITGAGLACPDWPLCHGRLVPPLEGPVLIEYLHRLVAASVSLLVAFTAAAAIVVRTRAAGAVAMAASTLLIVAVQIVLGALTVKLRLSPALVTIHLAVANLFLAALLVQAVGALRGAADAPPALPLRRTAYAAMAATYVMILIGGYVASSGAGFACPDLPLCRGASAMPADPGAHAHMLHRIWSLVVLGLVLAAGRAASRTGWRPAVVTGRVASALVLAQFALGLLNVATRLAPVVRVAHLGTAALLFGSLVVLSRLATPAPKPAEAARAGRTARVVPIAGGSIDDPARLLPWVEGRTTAALLRGAARTAADYLALMKPRIIMLLLVTTATTMIVASPHRIGTGVLLLTLLGGALAAGSANAFNMFVDRDIDAVMRRTCLRPVPAGRMRPVHALGFGIATGLLSVAVMAWGVNTLSALLSTAGIAFYVIVYTLWLKRTTPQNIVIGGAAGAVPPLVGWAAATGHLSLPAFVLFAIVFFWTPPHFWALALGKTEDYRAAGVPMLPVVRGRAETQRQILLYSLVLAATTLLLYVPFHACGTLYLGAALLLNAIFVALAAAVARGRTPWAAPALFGYSILYLGLLFGSMVMDRLFLG